MKPTNIQITALYFTGIIALLGMVSFCWCGIWKIYLDVPMLLVLSNITVGAVSSFTTLLTGRTISQLNQPSPDSQTTMTQTTQLVTKPKVDPNVPLVITQQPEVAVATEQPIQQP